MSLREILLVLFLFAALALIVTGVALLSHAAAFIVAGAGVGAIGFLALAEVSS